MVELETDKAIVEMPAPRAGVVLHHGAPAGATIAVDSLLVVIGTPGEAWTPSAAPPPQQREVKPIVGNLEESAVTPIGKGGALPWCGEWRRRSASTSVRCGDPAPAVGFCAAMSKRRRAEQVRWSGCDYHPPGSPSLATSPSHGRRYRTSPHSVPPIRRPSSRRAHDSPRVVHPSPSRRSWCTPSCPCSLPTPSSMPPSMGTHFCSARNIDIGVAVDTPEGLMVAVVRAADSRDVLDLSAEIVRLAGAAKARTIAASDLRGATFTISNIGAVGGGYGTPIIPYGTTAILSVGHAEEKARGARWQDRRGSRDAVVAVVRPPRDRRCPRRAFLAAVVTAIEGVK